MIVALKPKLTVSGVQAQTIVDRSAPGGRLAGIRELHGGEIGAVFALELAGAPDLILKVYPDTLHWKMRKEMRVSGLLDGKLAIPTPRILLSDDSKTLLDFNFLVMSRLAGTPLLDVEKTLDKPELSAIYVQMGEVLHAIHEIAMEAFGYIGPDGIVAPAATNLEYMSAQFAKKLESFSELGGRPELARKLKAYVERSQPLLEACTSPRLCHFDFHPGNLLVERVADSLKLCGLLDLENAVAGDPLMDLARTFSYATRTDATKRAGLFAGYGRIERRGWPATLALYAFYSVIELWVWWTEIGDQARAASLIPDLEYFAAL
jgi:aminoglycoside phosphotransferase (APT) family kinase protein